MERCVSCQYYDRQNGKASDGKSMHSGPCRRAAPKLNPVNPKSYLIEGVWPTVRDDDWCGEWKGLVRRVDPVRNVEAPGPSTAQPRPTRTEGPRATMISATPVQPPRPPVTMIGAGGVSPGQTTAVVTPFAFGTSRGD